MVAEIYFVNFSEMEKTQYEIKECVHETQMPLEVDAYESHMPDTTHDGEPAFQSSNHYCLPNFSRCKCIWTRHTYSDKT